MSTRAHFWTRIILGLIFTALGCLLLFGCADLQRAADTFMGAPSLPIHDANGLVIGWTAPQPGYVSPVTEAVALLVTCLGFPALALWIRAVSKGAQVTKALLDVTRNGTPAPPQ